MLIVSQVDSSVVLGNESLSLRSRPGCQVLGPYWVIWPLALKSSRVRCPPVVIHADASLCAADDILRVTGTGREQLITDHVRFDFGIRSAYKKPPSKNHTHNTEEPSDDTRSGLEWWASPVQDVQGSTRHRGHVHYAPRLRRKWRCKVAI